VTWIEPIVQFPPRAISVLWSRSDD